MDVILVLIIYLLFVNLIGFSMMGIDKQRAKKRAFRIPEATLFLVALIGGSIGSCAGMYVFRHKTKHWYFRFGFPLIIILQVLLVYFIIQSPIIFEIM